MSSLDQAIIEYFEHTRCAKRKGVGKHLKSQGESSATETAIQQHLDALVSDGRLVTRNGFYCLPENANSIPPADKNKPTKMREWRENPDNPRSKAALQRAVAEHQKDEKPKRRPALRLTQRSGAPTQGGKGSCDKCRRNSATREHLEHTTWGDIDLCRNCCIEVQGRPRAKLKQPKTRIIYTPTGKK